MKHLKTYERRDYKSYKKYSDYIATIFEHSNNDNIVNMSEEDGKIYLSFGFYRAETKEIKKMVEVFGNYKMELSPIRNGVHLTVRGIDKEFLDKLDLEMSANKYNL